MFGFCKSDPEIPIEQLDYQYIKKCDDVKKLIKLLKILRSGEEGTFPDLIKFTEEQIRQKNPNSELLPTIKNEISTKQLERDERESIVNSIKSLDEEKHLYNGHFNGEIPPIRNSKNLEAERNKNITSHSNKKRVTPRSYDELSKFDMQIEKDGVQMKESDTSVTAQSKAHQLNDLKIDGLSVKDLLTKATREKEKGNEAFRSFDFEEALVYYNRSILLHPIAAAHNNRAMTYINLKRYKEAIEDCNIVINEEPNNIKAFLRRGLAYKSLNRLELALADFTTVMETEPSNKRGKELYESVFKEIEKSKEKNGVQKSNSIKKGKRLVIEEVDNTGECIPQPREKSQNITSESRERYDTGDLTANLFSNRTTPEITSTSPEVMLTVSEMKTASPKLLPIVNLLPDDVMKMKNEGNELYKIGQYENAYDKYTVALHTLLEEPSSFLSAISSLYNNRAICQLKIGKCKSCVEDCTKALHYAPSVKALLRRAKAYETMEKYSFAYLDLQTAFSRDRAVTTSQDMARVAGMLRRDYGKDWRSKLPKASLINWDFGSTSQTKSASSGTNTCCTSNNHTADSNVTTPTFADSTTNNNSPTESIPQKKDSRETVRTAEATETTTGTPLTVDAISSTITTGTITSISNNTKLKSTTPPNYPEQNNPKVCVSTDGKTKGSETVKEQYREKKDKGNKFVQKGMYEEAVTCYTDSIQLLPDETTSYTNRALCFLKLNKPTNTIEDCTKALEIQPNIVKALFRRAQAHKMLKQYKSALSDLVSVLKLEPNNTAAKNEMDACKELYRTQLKGLGSKSASEKQSSKKSKKLKIEEVCSEDINHSKSKSTTKTETCPMAKNISTASAPPSITNSQLSSKKMNSYEFMQKWNSVRAKKSADYAEILRQIEPAKLPELMSNKIDGDILSNFIRSVYEHFTGEDFRVGLCLLKSMSRVQRFSTMLMFLGTADKTLIRQTIDLLENKLKQTEASLNEISQIRSAFLCS